jgi:hypothetical protein
MVAECDKAPLVPPAVIVKLPVAAPAVAVNITEALPPALRENGLAGFALTPVGTPSNDTCTVPLNPFLAATLILIPALDVPCTSETALLGTVIEKSASGGGTVTTFADPPPQPAQNPSHDKYK